MIFYASPQDDGKGDMANNKTRYERIWAESGQDILEYIRKQTPQTTRARTKKGSSLEQIADVCDLSPRDAQAFVEFMKAKGANIYTKGDKVFTKPVLSVTRWTHKDLLEPKALDVFGEKKEGYCFGLVSDTHFGSNRTNVQVLQQAYDHFQELGITDVLHAGNVLAGKPQRAYKEADRMVVGLEDQVALFSENYPLKKGMKTHFILGHNDRTYERDHTNPAMLITEARPDFNYLGIIEADLVFEHQDNKPFRVRLYNEKLRYDYGISYQAQKKVETLAGGDRPQVWLVGGTQQDWSSRYQNVEIRKLAGLQHQTMRMRDRAYPCTVGFYVCIIVPEKKRPHLYTFAHPDMAPGPEPAMIQQGRRAA